MLASFTKTQESDCDINKNCVFQITVTAIDVNDKLFNFFFCVLREYSWSCANTETIRLSLSIAWPILSATLMFPLSCALHFLFFMYIFIPLLFFFFSSKIAKIAKI